MATVALLGFAVVGVLATLLVWSLARRQQTSPAGSPQVRALLTSARRRTGLAIITSAAVFVLLIIIGAMLPRLLGLPFALAAGIGASVGLLVYAARPPQALAVTPTTPRQASLTLRTPWTHLPRASAVALLIMVVLEVGFLLITGLTASTDEAGYDRQIAFQQGDHGSAAGPYPGWFYAVPLLIVTAVLAIAIVITLRRVASVPALPSADEDRLDSLWRYGSNRIVLLVSLAAVMFQTGGVAVFAGSAIHNAAADLSRSGLVLGWSVAGAGCVLLLASIAAFTLGAVRAITLPQLVGGQAGPAKAAHPGATTAAS